MIRVARGHPFCNSYRIPFVASRELRSLKKNKNMIQTFKNMIYAHNAAIKDVKIVPIIGITIAQMSKIKNEKGFTLQEELLKHEHILFILETFDMRPTGTQYCNLSKASGPPLKKHFQARNCTFTVPTPLKRQHSYTTTNKAFW